tara:strand:+ start:1829 stop:2248 length:420 start_codon:yes stop_codon:yes gene_type:complete
LIPRFDGAILSQAWKEALCDLFVTAAPRQRTPSELQYSDPLPGSVMRNMVPTGASFARAAKQRVGQYSQDSSKMAQACDARGSEDRAKGAPLVRATMARGIQFAAQPRNRNTAYSRQMHSDMICEANWIEHRLTTPNHS